MILDELLGVVDPPDRGVAIGHDIGTRRCVQQQAELTDDRARHRHRGDRSPVLLDPQPAGYEDEERMVDGAARNERVAVGNLFERVVGDQLEDVARAQMSLQQASLRPMATP